MEQRSLQVPTPCVRICELDANDVCIGCRRTREEIGAWSQADNAGRLRILAQARLRAADMPAFPES